MKNILNIIFASSILLLAGCTSSEESSEVEEIKVDIRLYTFTVGDIFVKDVALFSPGIDEGQSISLTNSAYLIRHPKGDLIWDTGLPDALAKETAGSEDDSFIMKMPKTLISQLEEIEVSPSEIEFLAVSHMHGDHIGNMNLFTNATILLQEEEYDGLFNSEEPNPNVSALTENEHIDINGDHDVFGDGTVIIKRAIGHTPGHQVLFIDLPETGPIVLSGDLYHFTKNRAQRGVPTFNFDVDLSLQAMDDIEAFLEESGATLWIQHDVEENEARVHSPEFVQ